MKESEKKWKTIDVIISKIKTSLNLKVTEDELKKNEARKAEWETFRNKYTEELDNTEKSVNELNSQYGNIQRQFFQGKKKLKDQK
jgi:uncharacterized protein YeaO (DUF488 family)